MEGSSSPKIHISRENTEIYQTSSVLFLKGLCVMKILFLKNLAGWFVENWSLKMLR